MAQSPTKGLLIPYHIPHDLKNAKNTENSYVSQVKFSKTDLLYLYVEKCCGDSRIESIVIVPSSDRNNAFKKVISFAPQKNKSPMHIYTAQLMKIFTW